MNKYASNIDSDSKSNTVFMFTSPTCGQCKMLKPRIEKVASEHSDYSFYEVDTTTPEGMTLAQRYSVSMLPTVVVMSTDTPIVLAGAGQVAGGLAKTLQ